MNNDSVMIFQALNQLEVDGQWGPASAEKWSDPRIRRAWENKRY